MIWLWQLYIAASLILVWGFIVFMWARGFMGSGSSDFARLTLYAVPGLMAIGFKWIVEHRGFRRVFPELGLSLGRPAFWPLALGLPAAVVALGHGLPLLTGLVRFDPSLSRLANELSGAGQSIPPDIWGFFWARFGFAFSVGLLLFFPLALLIEMGFRSYPIALLSENFGTKLNLIIVGAFWTLAFSPFLFFKNPYGSWLGIPIYLAFYWGWGVLMAWLYINSRTVLVPALALVILDLLDGSLSYILPGSPLFSGAEGLFGAAVVLVLGLLALFFTREIYIPQPRAAEK